MTVRQLVLADFEPTINANAIVIVEFLGDSPDPRGQVGPDLENPTMFENAAKKHPDVIFARVDLATQPKLAAEYGVQRRGTWMVFRDGLMVFKAAEALLDTVFDGLIVKTKALDMSVVRAKLVALERSG